MVDNSNMPHPKCLGSQKNPGTEPKTCEKGPKLGFEHLPTSKTSHCVRTACALRAWHSLCRPEFPVPSGHRLGSLHSSTLSSTWDGGVRLALNPPSPCKMWYSDDATLYLASLRALCGSLSTSNVGMCRSKICTSSASVAWRSRSLAKGLHSPHD